MTRDRWRQIENLYHLAREQGTGVLAETDPEMRREVERLLAEDSGNKILDRPVDDLFDELAGSPAPQFAAPDRSGQTISHYRILEKLGAGGMGVVYKAFDDKLGRLVALKFLAPHVSHDRELRENLAAEARAASALDHPNIVVVYDIDETPEGDIFIAMALHDGATLRERMREGLTTAAALRIARQLASGLARAHANNIFHRDIKPANIIVAKDGVARIIDFGLAKTNDSTMTAVGSARGTPLYMSPEQAAGKTIDYRTDLWSLGAVLYEMLTGQPPFPGDSPLGVMHSIVNDPAPRLAKERPDLPPEIDNIVSRALQKDPGMRYSSAAEVERDIAAALAALESPAPRGWRFRGPYAWAAAGCLLLLSAAAVWLYRRIEAQQWAQEQIPRIAALAANQPVAAFQLWKAAAPILPGDPQLKQIEQRFTRIVSVDSDPEGEKIEIQDYLSPNGPWLSLGTSPLKNATLPQGQFRWRLSRPGGRTFIAAPEPETAIHIALPTPDTPPGMVPVPGGVTHQWIDFIGLIGGNLPNFDIDQYEVTNAQYQEFIDHGGYSKPEYWNEKFVKDGKELSFAQAMELFRDSTGRLGPASWEGGHFPPGRADYPVSGVSWYEAAAYAAYAGKSLPTISQWYKAAPPDQAVYSINQSNFGSGPVPVKLSGGVGPYGTYGMSGNVREWCLNAVDDGKRFLLGGAWQTQTYAAYDPDAQQPLDRSELNGIRCVRNHGPLPVNVAAPVVRQVRDFSNAKPASDAEFETFRVMYGYDAKAPVDPRNETVVENTPDWIEEKLTIDAGYDEERLPVYFFLPKNVRPPFQAIVFFPSARVNTMPASDKLGDLQFVDYAIQSGRALIYPIYAGTYERRSRSGHTSAIGGLDTVIKQSKEVRRAVDYLETRRDIDRSEIAYLGVSQGSAFGVDYAALEDRFRALILLDGGFFLGKLLPAVDQVNFAPRVRKPALMVNGRYDFSFSQERSQLPMFRMLGTPAADKRFVSFEAPHDVSQRRPELSKEVLGWLDKYLGRVN